MSANIYETMAQDVLESARKDAQELHNIVKTVRGAKGTPEDRKAWIANSTEESVVARREKIAAAKARIAELEAELDAEALEALVDPNVDIEKLSSEFKDRRKDVIETLSAARILLKKAGFDKEALTEIDDLQNNLPSKITGLSTGGGRSPEETKRIREWAQANGHDVNARGRISEDIIKAYFEAQAS
jgi:hypothetical protein